MARELATGYVSLAISAGDVGRDLTAQFKMLPNMLGKVGKSAGTSLSSEFGKSTAGMAKSVERETKLASDAVESASNKQARSLRTYQDAIKATAIAEAKLAEVQASKNTKQSGLLTAQANLARAQDKVTDSGKVLQTETANLDAAQDRLAASTKNAGDQAGKSVGHFQRFGNAVHGVDTGKLRAGLVGLGAGMASAGGYAARAGAAVATGLGAGMAAVVTMAGRAEQSVGGVQSVFGAYADTVIADSKRAAEGFGLSAVQYQELATTLGSTLKNKGISDFGAQTKNLVTLGGDLAATFGGDAKTAVEALSSAMRGESDPIERYGVSLNEAAIKAKMSEMGLIGLTGAAEEAGKTQARLALIMEQTSAAQGQAGREHNTFAATLERVKSQAMNLGAELGTALLPAAQNLMQNISDSIPKIKEWADAFIANMVANGPQIKAAFDQITAAVKTVFDGLVAFGKWAIDHKDLMAGLAIGIGVVAVAIGAMTVALWAMSLTPVALIVGAIVLAIGLLAVGIAYLAIKWDTIWAGIKAAAQAVGDWFAGPFAGFFTGIWSAITGAFSAAGAAIAGVLQSLWNWVAGVFSVLWGGLVGIFGGPISVVLSVIEVFAAAGLMVLTAAWNGVVAAATWLWGQLVAIWTAISGFLQPYVEAIRVFVTGVWTALVNGVTAAVTWLRDQLVMIWTAISDRVCGIVQPLVDWAVGAFTGLRDRAVGIFNDLKTTVISVFDGLKAGIEKVWNGIKAVFSAPVRWVVDVVINPLIRGFNTLADKVGMKDSKLDEWKFDGFARGGILPGYTPYARGDDQLVGMRSGEGVYVSEAMQDPRERARLHAVNAAALSGHTLDDFHTGIAAGYAGGGIIIGGSGTWTPTFAAEMIRASLIAGINFLVSQRGFRPSTSYSGSTHNKDAVDVTGPVGQFGQIVAALRAVGIAAWDRTGKGNWVPHVHGVPLPGHGEASPSAAAQAADFLRGGDGLGGIDNASGAPAFDILGALTSAFSGPLGKLKELGDSGFGGLVKGIPGMVVEGMKSKLTSVWNGAVGAVQSGGNFALAGAMATGRGWSPANTAALLWLIQKESGGRVNATNPSSGAYGIPQALPGSKMASAGADWRTNPRTQITWMEDYIEDRFGSAISAKAFHQSHNWYDEGGILPEGLTLARNSTGGPEAILTEPQWDAMYGAATARTTVDVYVHEERMRGLIRAEIRQAAREGEIVRAA